ncbi:MAG: S8 family peptidase [Flavobacteriales bacterium]|nr:S8 family peptidase [Flavobacteriales bacterium]
MKRIVTIGLIALTVVANAQYQKQVNHFSMPNGVTEADYMAKTVVVKFNEAQRVYCSENDVVIQSFNNYISGLGLVNLKKKFRRAEKPLVEFNKYGMKLADLSLIYEFEYTSSIELEKVISHLYSMGIIEYAQPNYVYHLSYSPNDPEIATQTHLSKINAYNAWDINKGDTSVVIGIVDTGWDNDHEDLQDELKHNYDDPINGVDDDNVGYIDNYNGWDMYGEDNDPQAAGSQHGVHVAGCASPSTDNGLGVSGPGFNTMLLPLKAGDGTTVDYGYEGITYCADQGVDVINCSWGGPGGGQLGQDVVTYATINKDALVVAAAGNDNSSDDQYPSSFEYVLSVAATELTDLKSGYSNYGYTVDVCAPGTIWATYDGGGYGSMSGTSMASPVVAGAAALVKSQHSWLNALQIGEVLKVTADDIYSLNGGYIDMLGTGRINLANALGAVSQPSIDMNNKNVTDNGDEAFVIGDILFLSGTFINYLAPSGNLTATISTVSPYMNIMNNTYVIGTLGMMGTADNSIAPFTAEILPGTPLNSAVVFQIDITDGTTTWIEYMTVTVNVDYINIDINDVATSITSKGMIGYNLDNQAEGLGFTYMNSSSILWDAALMIGTSDGRVMDMVRGASGTSDQDFTPYTNVSKLVSPVFSEFDVEGVFDDSGAAADQLGIQIDHKAFAWTTAGHTKYIIVEYTIENQSGSVLPDLYAGIYGDWDIADAGANACATSSSRFLGYIYDVGFAGVYAGVQVLTDGGFNHHAMFNNGNDGGGINPNDNYDSGDKYTTLSTAVSGAGGISGADVSNVVSTGPSTLASGDSVTVAFALIAGDDLADLEASADSAYAQYNGVLLEGTGIEAIHNNDVAQLTIYPNPSNGITNVSFYNDADQNVRLTVYDVTGTKVKALVNTTLDEGNYSYSFDLSDLEAGVYFYELNIGVKTAAKKLTLY